MHFQSPFTLQGLFFQLLLLLLLVKNSAAILEKHIGSRQSIIMKSLEGGPEKFKTISILSQVSLGQAVPETETE